MQDWYGLTDFEILSEMGRRLKTVRITKNLTQQDVAVISGLNRSTVRDMENGKPLNALSLIQVFRCLRLLPKLDDFLPEIENSPVIATQQMQRKRVKPSSKNKQDSRINKQ